MNFGHYRLSRRSAALKKDLSLIEYKDYEEQEQGSEPLDFRKSFEIYKEENFKNVDFPNFSTEGNFITEEQLFNLFKDAVKIGHAAKKLNVNL